MINSTDPIRLLNTQPVYTPPLTRNIPSLKSLAQPNKSPYFSGKKMNNPTERRLALLEQQLRQTRRFNRLLVGALLLLAFMGFRKNEELQHLQVKSLSVVNEGGKVVAKLDANASSGWLQLMDSSGTLHAQAGAGTNGGYLNLFNKKKQHTVWLTQMTEGGGYVGVKNPSGKEVAWLGVKQDESGYAGTADWSGNTRVTMGSHNGSGFTEWYNRNGYGTVKLYANDNSNGGGAIGLYSYFGDVRNYMGIDNNGNGASWLYNRSNTNTISLLGGTGLVLKNYQGKDRAWLGVAENNGGFINLYNRYDRRNIYLGARDGLTAEGILYTSDGFRDKGTFPN